MHNRRARPTLRVLREDLISGWDSPHPQRHVSAEKFDELHPLSELPHPIISKARESFGNDAADDNYVGPISSTSDIHLLEIKQSQWRGGVWQDANTGVCWLVTAGLAKGGHLDHDDFYQRLRRAVENGGLHHLLPTDADIRLLKRETAARLRTDWWSSRRI